MNDKTNLKDDENFFRNRKSRTCPSYNGKNISVILYGYSLENVELIKAVEDKKIIFGGYCVSENDPTWQCTDCHIEIWRHN